MFSRVIVYYMYLLNIKHIIKSRLYSYLNVDDNNIIIDKRFILTNRLLKPTKIYNN